MQTVIGTFIGHTVNVDFSVVPFSEFSQDQREKINVSIGKLNKTIEALTESYKELSQLDNDYARLITSHFFSLEQFFFILSHTTNNDEFAKAIKKIG